MRLPKRERVKQKKLRKNKKKLKFRIPIAPPSRRHKTKKDYKRINKVDYDPES